MGEIFKEMKRQGGLRVRGVKVRWMEMGEAGRREGTSLSMLGPSCMCGSRV